MTTDKTIEEMNRAIAEFMGWEFIDDNGTIHAYFNEEKRWIDTPKFLESLFVNGFKYHEDWNQLKPVIDKIFEYALAYPEQVDPIRKMSIVVEIKAAHKAAYEFIQWFNTTTKQKD